MLAFISPIHGPAGPSAFARAIMHKALPALVATGLLSLLSACGGGVSPATLAKSQTLQFGAAPALVLGQSAQVSATASSGLGVSFSSLTTAVCQVQSTGLVTALSTGTCVVAANQAGNADYQPAPQITQSLVVQTQGLAAQSIRFGSAPSLTLGGSATVTAQASSGLAVRYGSLTPLVCSVGATSGLVQGLALGTCTVTADQDGNTLYAAASQVAQTLTVSPATSVGVPEAPTGLKASLGTDARTVVISIGATASGGSPVTGYQVSSVPAGLNASASSSPIQVSCGTSCAGYAWVVNAVNALGTGPASEAVQVITDYQITATFYEPQTQPNNSIFTGSFSLNSTTRRVSGLSGLLTQSMTDTPMSTVPLSRQGAHDADSTGTGVLVGAFYLATNNTFVVAHGNEGWRPGVASDARYYGYPAAANPSAGGVGNAYALVFVNTDDPSAAPSNAQLQQTAYADCTALGMMGASCMTGTAAAVYGTVGTMGGYPLSQVVVRRP